MSYIHVSPPAPTGVPGGLTSTYVESRSLSVEWGIVPCPQQEGSITGYRLRYTAMAPPLRKPWVTGNTA